MGCTPKHPTSDFPDTPSDSVTAFTAASGGAFIKCISNGARHDDANSWNAHRHAKHDRRQCLYNRCGYSTNRGLDANSGECKFAFRWRNRNAAIDPRRYAR
jgi:hypothetical protein